MTGATAPRLRLLAAELRGELTRIDRTVSEHGAAAPLLADPGCPRLALYGAAALLETFYTRVEKARTRVAAVTGGMPEGAAWHRKLPEDATLDLPKLRPPVLRATTARLLEPYLAFRHRFRNLYLFDLDAGLTAPLVVRCRSGMEGHPHRSRPVRGGAGRRSPTPWTPSPTGKPHRHPRGRPGSAEQWVLNHQVALFAD